MISLDTIMSWPWVYRAWMAPFAEKKFAPIVAHNDLRRVQRALDVGCGPGTNARHFRDVYYLGIDLNERYIESARRRHGDHFIAADAAEFVAKPSEQFDFILVNSFLHHIDTPTVRRILLNLARLLTDDGQIHILELVLPPDPSVPRFLARADRGKYPREQNEWAIIFHEAFEEVILEPFQLKLSGFTLWEFVYFKGCRLRAA
jgi:SAM-dependent methyltransferase